MAQAQVGEGRDGPTAAIGRIRQVCADLPAHRGLLLGDPTTATWLIRTALAAGDNELAELFRKAQADSRKGATMGKDLLRQRLSG